MTKAQANKLMGLAIGRLMRLGSRPAQPGDAEQLAKLRRVVFECDAVLKG